jgi:hypothetical protein
VSGVSSGVVEGDDSDREAGAPQWPTEEEADSVRHGDSDRETKSGMGAIGGRRSGDDSVLR